MNKNDQQSTVQKIRDRYIERQPSDLDTLRRLDAKVKHPANLFAYIFGSISAIIMGAGMSLVMTDIGQQLGISNTMPLGIVIGVVGMLMAAATYPIYKNILASRKEKYADRILELSDKIMNEEK